MPKRRNRKAFEITDTELRLMARAATMGETNSGSKNSIARRILSGICDSLFAICYSRFAMSL